MSRDRCFACGRPLSWHTAKQLERCQTVPLKLAIWDGRRWVDF